MSKKVQRVVEVVLTTMWLSGTSFLLEVKDIGWSGPIVLLVVVVVLDVVFEVWNRGGLKAIKDADKKASQG